MTDVAAGDLRYTFGTFPVIWGMPVETIAATSRPEQRRAGPNFG